MHYNIVGSPEVLVIKVQVATEVRDFLSSRPPSGSCRPRAVTGHREFPLLGDGCRLPRGQLSHPHGDSRLPQGPSCDASPTNCWAGPNPEGGAANKHLVPLVVKDNQLSLSRSNRGGWRMGERGGISSSIPPRGANRARMVLAKFFWCGCGQSSCRTSSSMDRPFSRSRRFSSSSGLCTVLLVMMATPSTM